MAEKFDPAGFFEVLLPALLLDRQAAFASLDAVIQFYLMGPTDRAYYLDLTQRPPAVFPGETRYADLTIAIAEELVLPLIAGTLDVREALAAETLQVAGEASVLEGLAAALDGGLSGMDILYASVRR